MSNSGPGCGASSHDDLFDEAAFRANRALFHRGSRSGYRPLHTATYHAAGVSHPAQGLPGYAESMHVARVYDGSRPNMPSLGASARGPARPPRARGFGARLKQRFRSLGRRFGFRG